MLLLSLRVYSVLVGVCLPQSVVMCECVSADMGVPVFLFICLQV